MTNGTPTDGDAATARQEFTVWLDTLNWHRPETPADVEPGRGHRHRARKDMYVVQATDEADAINRARGAAYREAAAYRRAR